MSPERKKVFNALPDQFKPADIRRLAKEFFLDRQWLHEAGWSQTVVKSFLFDGVAEQIKRGIYKKTEEVKS